jgi:ATP-binding cassette subfamily F protein 3
LLNISDLSYSIGERTLFSGVTVAMNRLDRFGLVGANGTGKTTLLRIIIGDVSPTTGKVSRSAGFTIGYLPQEEIVLRGNTVIDEVLLDHNALLARIREIEKRMAAAPRAADIIREYERAHDEFHHHGGYDFESRARKVAVGLGFTAEDFARSVEQFSSGWQMRIVLARLLLLDPDLLLLDEPTNHLDIESIQWLEEYLVKFRGAILVVSHDRYFLDRVLKTTDGISGIWELDFGRFERYRANYSAYLQESQARKQRIIQLAKTQQRKIVEIKDFIARNKANKKKAGVVKSREKYLERMEIIEAEAERKKIRVSFPVEPIFSRQLVQLNSISKVYDGKTVLHNISTVIERGNKIALIGKNGAGKSTLCRIIAGIEEPTTGERKASGKVMIGAFSHEIMLGLDPSSTVIEEAQKNALPHICQNIRSYLGLFLFSGDDVFKKVSVLSGGEKTRLAMLKTMVKPSNMLVLDEPTFHLDRDSVDSIRQAVQFYEGTLIFVTHDRDLIASFADRVLEIKNGALIDYPGDFSCYLWKRDHPAAGAAPQPALAGAGAKAKKGGKQLTMVERIKKQIMVKEKRRSKLRDTFSRPGFIENPRRSKKFFEEYQRLSAEIEELEKQLAAEQNDVPVKQ